MRRSLILPLLLAVTAFAACGAETTPVAQDLTHPRAETPTKPRELAGFDRDGGRCTYGPCHDSLTVLTDGSWTATTGEEVREGTLTPDELEALTAAVSQADLVAKKKPEQQCAAWSDGADYTVRLQAADGEPSVEVSTCDYELTQDPVLAELARLHGDTDVTYSLE
jgi:hypothetical protein